MSLQKNLARIRKERGLSQVKLSQLASVSQQLISRLESGTDLTTKKLPDIARALGVSVFEIDENYAPEKDTAPAGAVSRIPLLDTVTAGKLRAPSSQIPVEDVPLLAFADLGRGEFFALTVQGDSMDRISPDGAVIVVNQADRTLVSGKAYVISQRGEATFKLWRPDPPRFAPHSTNPVHEPIFVKSKSDAEKMVVGRVKRSVLDL
jgi:SOS-response transcriptional repressor LexA